MVKGAGSTVVALKLAHWTFLGLAVCNLLTKATKLLRPVPTSVPPGPLMVAAMDGEAFSAAVAVGLASAPPPIVAVAPRLVIVVSAKFTVAVVVVPGLAADGDVDLTPAPLWCRCSIIGDATDWYPGDAGD